MSDLMHPLAEGFRLDGEQSEAFLLLHGWTGSPAHLRPAAGFLRSRGFTVSVPRLAGHGTTLEHMMDTGWRDWVRSALAGLMALQDDFERVHLAGLSMGGVIALLLAATDDVASVTTINAPQRLRHRRIHLARFARGSRRIDVGEPRQLPDESVAQFWVQYADSPVGTVGDLLDLMDATRRALPRVVAPAVVIQSLADETVQPRSAQIIYRGLSSSDKRIVWLDRSGHVALLDVERARIHDALLIHTRAG